MIRSTLHRLATTSPASSKLALTVARPASAVLAGKIPLCGGGRWLSTNPKKSRRRAKDDDDELVNKSYSDAFDESDSIEVGKKNEKQQQQQLQKKQRHVPVRHRYNGPVFPPLLRGFDDFFAPSIFGRDPFAPFRRAERMMDEMMMTMPSPLMFQEMTPFSDDITSTAKKLLRSSPGYRIKESKEAYEISVDIPEDLTASDMEIELENDGTVLHVSGERKVEEDDYVSQSWFDKRFTIGPNVDKDRIAANFHDGVLVMTAPKLEVEEALEKPKHTIPITEKPHITDEELVEKNYSDAFDESDWAETGKAASLEKEQQKE